MMGSKRSIGSSIMVVVISTILLVGIKGSFAQETVDRSCLVTMSECMEDSSSILDCCPHIKDAIADERECFCLTKEIFAGNATLERGWANILIFCSVTATMDSLCPDSNSSSTIVPASSSPESSPSIEPSPTESDPVSPTPGIEPAPTESDPVSPPAGDPTPSSPSDDVLFPPTPATDNDTSNESGDENDTGNNGSGENDGDYTSNNGNGDENDDKDTSKGGGGTSIIGVANKIGYQMVLLSSSALLIWAILLS